MKNVTNYMSNPINVFITVKSLVTDLKNTEHLITTIQGKILNLVFRGSI